MSQAFSLDTKLRIYATHLGGGALLDIGVYPLTSQFLTLYKHPKNARFRPDFSATSTRSELTGVDDGVVIVGNYHKVDDGALGIASTTLKASSHHRMPCLFRETRATYECRP